MTVLTLTECYISSWNIQISRGIVTSRNRKIVFSNILEKSDSIFFFRRWQDTYGAFQRRIRKRYLGGMRWVGDFDLAAFYDRISHELLLKTLYPRTTSGDLDWVAQCLRTWSSDRAASGHGHGLPQGPLASDFLAEACTIIDKKGQLVDFGVTLDAAGPFSKNCPTIADCFREMNARRNYLPVAHPYEKKTATQSRHLKPQERNRFVAKLRVAYADFVVLMPSRRFCLAVVRCGEVWT